MRLSFNTSGPCLPGKHYMLPPERRLGRVLELIEDHRYFTLHAGRQTGKTTSLRWLESHLNGTGQWRAVWVDLETAREQDDVARVMEVVLSNLDRTVSQRLPHFSRPDRAELDAGAHVHPAAADRRRARVVRARGRLARPAWARWSIEEGGAGGRVLIVAWRRRRVGARSVTFGGS